MEELKNVFVNKDLFAMHAKIFVVALAGSEGHMRQLLMTAFLQKLTQYLTRIPALIHGNKYGKLPKIHAVLAW